jgi:hypothetical protein
LEQLKLVAGMYYVVLVLYHHVVKQAAMIAVTTRAKESTARGKSLGNEYVDWVEAPLPNVSPNNFSITRI